LTGSFLPVSAVENGVPQKDVLVRRAQSLSDDFEKLMAGQFLQVAAHLPITNADLAREGFLSRVAGSVFTCVPNEPAIGDLGTRRHNHAAHQRFRDKDSVE
jgi:hypothetical protein